MDKSSIKVLLIEDNPGDARLIQEMLKEAATTQFELTHVDRLAAGLGRLGEEMFDVVLLDPGLPDSHGLDTFTKTRTQAPDVPVVLLSGLDDESIALEAVRKGAQDYLLKGRVDSHLLTRAVHYAIERHRAEEALLQRNRELALLNELGQELSATLDFQQLTERLLQAVTETIGAEGGLLWLRDEELEGCLVGQAAFPPEQNRFVVDLRLSPGQGIAGWVAQQVESAIVADVQNDPRFVPGSDEQAGFHTNSLLAVPLRARDQVIGILEMVNKREGDFDGDDLALVETLAASAAIAIQNAFLVESLRRQTAKLQMRNEELDAFAHTVAHDLKGPLGHMVGFAHFLAEDYGTLPGKELRRYLIKIVQSGHNMSNIIDELMLLAGVRKMEEVELRPLDMSNILARVQERLAFMLEEHQAEINLPESWPVPVGYGPWVEEVWINYLSNAIKYGGRSPKLDLGAAAQTDGTVRFWVSDSGPGLTTEEQARLFKPFTRVDQVSVKGHGLGLSIVRRIVEKLGGQVGVESQVGKGSVFSFTLLDAEQ
jgi:signal transduction histidine kinase